MRLVLRWLRGNLRRIVFWSLVLLLGALGLSAFVLHSPLAVTWAMERGLPRVNKVLPGDIEVGAWEGTLGDRLRLDDVVIRDEFGTTVVAVRQAEVRWEAWDLLVGKISLQEVRLTDPDVLLEVRKDGRLGIAAAFTDRTEKKSTRGTRQPLQAPIEMSVESLVLEGGTLRWTEEENARIHLQEIAIEGSWSWRDQLQDLALASLVARPKVPVESEKVEIVGGAQLEGLELTVDQLQVGWGRSRLVMSGPLGFVTSLELDLRTVAELESTDLAELWSSSPLEGRYDAELRISGQPSKSLKVEGEVLTPSGGRVGIQEVELRDLKQDGRVPQHVGEFVLDELSPSQLMPSISGLPEHVHGHLSWAGEGFSLPELRGKYSIDLEALTVQSVSLEEVKAKGTLVSSNLKVAEGSLRLDEGVVDLRGEADFSTRAFFIELEADLADLGDLRRLSKDWLRSGSAELQGFVRGNWGGDRWVDLVTEGEIELRRSVIGPTAQERASGEWDVALEIPRGGPPSLRGSAWVDGRGVKLGGGKRVTGLNLNCQFKREQAKFKLRGSRSADLLLRTEGVLDWEAYPSLVLTGGKLEVLAKDEHIESEGEFDAKLREGSFQVNHLQLKTETGTVFVQGSYNRPRNEVGANVRARGIELAEIPALTQAFTGEGWRWDSPSGLLNELFMKVSGRLSAPSVDLRANVSDMQLGTRPAFDLAADLSAASGGVTGWVESPGFGRLDVRSLPVALQIDKKRAPIELSLDDPWDVSLDLPRQDFARLVALVGVSFPEEIEAGSVQGNVTWTGSSNSPAVHSVASLTGVRAAGRSINAQVGWKIAEDRLEVSGTRLKTAAEGTIVRLEGGGRLPLGAFLRSRWGPRRQRQSDFSLGIDEIGVKAILSNVDMSLVHLLESRLEPMTGLMRGEVLLSGRSDQPELDAELEVVGARVGGRELHPIKFNTKLEGGRLTSDFGLRPKEGGALTGRAETTFPLRLQPITGREELLGSPDLVAELRGDGFPIDVVLAFVPGLTEEEGTLSVAGRVTGSLLHPEPDVALRVESAKACAPQVGLCYENVRLASVLRAGRLDISELWADTVPQVVNPIDIVRGRVRPGQRSGIGLKGSVQLSGLVPNDVELQFSLPRAWLMYSREIQVQVEGELGVRGTYPALKLVGNLDVQNVEIDLGQDTIGREVEELRLPANLRVHREKTRRGPGEQAAGGANANKESQFVAQLKKQGSAQVDLHLTNNVNVNLAVGVAGQSDAALAANLLGSVEPKLILGGDVELIWENEELAAVGEITTEKGSKLTVLTRQFLVEEGSSVEFVGAIPDAQLSIRALQQSGQGDVAVVVSDRLGSPRIDFESDQFEDQADMMSVLLTGKPLSELSAAEGGGTLGQITEALAGFGTKAFGKYVPVDRLAVDIGDDISSGSVEAGKALSPWLFFLTRFRWGAEEDENRIEGQLEFRFDRRGYVEVRMGDRLIGSADVVWKVHF